MVDGGHGAGRLLDVDVLAVGGAAELLREKLTLHQSEAVLARHRRTGFVDGRGIMVVLLIHGVVLQYPCLVLLLSSGHELHQPRINALQRLLAEWLLSHEDALSVVVKVEHVAHGTPLVIHFEHTAFVAVLGVSLFGESDGQSMAGKLSEVAFARGVGPEVCGV